MIQIMVLLTLPPYYQIHWMQAVGILPIRFYFARRNSLFDENKRACFLIGSIFHSKRNSI
jgi:hypothetical protein